MNRPVRVDYRWGRRGTPLHWTHGETLFVNLNVGHTMASKTNRSDKHGDLPIRDVRDAAYKVDDRNDFRVVPPADDTRTEAEQALVDVLDGNQPWDIAEFTGLSQDQCDEIWVTFTKALNKRPFTRSKP